MKYLIPVAIVMFSISCSSPNKESIAALNYQKKSLSDSLFNTLLIQNQFNTRTGMEDNLSHDTLKYYPLADSTEKYFQIAKKISVRITALQVSIDSLTKIK